MHRSTLPGLLLLETVEKHSKIPLALVRMYLSITEDDMYM